MSTRDNLHRLVEQIPEEKVAEVERIVLQMLRPEDAFGAPREGTSFEEALDYTFTHFDKALRNLAK